MLQLQRLFGNRAVTGLAQRVAEPGAASGAASHLVDGDPAPDQMTKDAFLAELQANVTSAASALLAPKGWTADSCPDLGRWFDYYRTKDAAHVERAIHKYAPATVSATSAREYIPAIASRVQRAVLTWTLTGEVTGVPEEAAAAPGAPPAPDTSSVAAAMGLGQGGAEAAPQRAARDGAAPADGASGAVGRLGEGQPLDDAVASRFGRALGGDFSDVRLHTGPDAAAAASALGARAFTYGRHVGFDRGEYQPGTPVGDAILAHELAHVDQQRGTAAGPHGPAARVDGAGARDEDAALEHDADRAATGAVAQLWGLAGEVAGGVLQGGGRLRASRPGLRRCRNNSSSTPAPLGPVPAPSTGPDHHAGINRPTAGQITAIDQALNPTTSGAPGVVLNWDGQHDAAKRQLLKTRLLTAMQNHLNAVNPHMARMQQAKAAGRVLSTAGQEGAGRAAKRYVDRMFGGIASAAMLTASQETARTAFQFTAGVNLLDASDPAVRPLDAALRIDLADWIADSDPDARQAQRDRGFNRRRTGQGEPAFYNTIRTTFMGRGSNSADLDRYNQFGFAYTEDGPRVLSQTALPTGGAFSNTPVNPGEPSPAERQMRWSTWETLVHEYIHTLEHPAFTEARQGNRILFEGFCELFTKAVLGGGGGGVATAKADGDPALRNEVEGGNFPGFDPNFVPGYDPGSYSDYLTQAEAIVAQVGMQAAKAAFFLGHVEAIGLKPDGTMIDPAAPDAHRFLAPEKVRIPWTVSTVRDVATMTGAGEAEIVAANPGLTVGGPVPAAAHSHPGGLIIPGVTQHRAVVARSAAAREVETKAKIAQQHGIAEADIVRANPGLAARQPMEGEWVLIPRH